ncbi:MAG: hypothetical protein ACTSPD_08155 [Promethearchaeota archaeon]
MEEHSDAIIENFYADNEYYNDENSTILAEHSILIALRLVRINCGRSLKKGKIKGNALKVYSAY